MRIAKEVAKYRVGEWFRNIDLQVKCGINVTNVSYALNRLRAEGKIEMVKRGTWKRLADQV